MGDEVELDFEEPGEEEEEQVDYFCGICIDCFDEKNEFLEHITSSPHTTARSDKLALLKPGQKYCSHCCTIISNTFDDHCKTHEHVEFVKCLEVAMPEYTAPSAETVPVESTEPRVRAPSGLADKIKSKKCIGIPHVERSGNGWFCGLCLENFESDLIQHCLKAQHAIQCVKTIEPHTALQLKKFALNNKDKFKALVSTKAKEIFDQEKATEKFKLFMLDLEKKPIKAVKQSVNVKEVQIISSSAETTAAMEITTVADTSYIADITTATEPDSIISLFEEADREIIPDTATTSSVSRTKSASREPKEPSTPRPIKCKDNTMIIGIKHIVKKGRDFWCDLCDIRCKNNPSTCRNHVTGSLHRRNMIQLDQEPPIPKYLQALRSSRPHLYNKILINESMKLEIKEREDESEELKDMRSRVLQVKVQDLPPNLCTGTGRDCPGAIQEGDDFNIAVLAAAWDEELTKKLNASFVKEKREPVKKDKPVVSRKEPSPKTDTHTEPKQTAQATPPRKSRESSGSTVRESSSSTVRESSSSSLITPIQPDEKNLLVGLNEIIKGSNGQYECRMCSIKFSSKKTWSQKSHITGRLHKVKALATRFGPEVEKYLDFKMKKSGYNSLMPEINKACVMLEQQEIEGESSETRSLRADILGVRVERLPLPLITLQTDPPYDIQRIAKEWAGKQSTSKPVGGKKEKIVREVKEVKEVKVVKEIKKEVSSAVEAAEPPVAEEQPSSSKVDVPTVDSDAVPLAEAIESNPNANPPIVEQDPMDLLKSQVKQTDRRRPESNTNKRKTPPSKSEAPPKAPPRRTSPPKATRRPSPRRNQPNRRVSPQRNQPNRRPSPRRSAERPARVPSPPRNQPVRRASPPRNNRGGRRSPPRTSGPPDRVRSPVRDDRQRNTPNRRTSPSRSGTRRTSPPRPDRRNASPPRDTSGRYSPPEPQLAPPAPSFNLANTFANALPATIDPQTRSTILQATRDAVAKVFDRNTAATLLNSPAQTIPANPNGINGVPHVPIIPPHQRPVIPSSHLLPQPGLLTQQMPNLSNQPSQGFNSKNNFNPKNVPQQQSPNFVPKNNQQQQGQNFSSKNNQQTGQNFNSQNSQSQGQNNFNPTNSQPQGQSFNPKNISQTPIRPYNSFAQDIKPSFGQNSYQGNASAQQGSNQSGNNMGNVSHSSNTMPGSQNTASHQNSASHQNTGHGNMGVQNSGNRQGGQRNARQGNNTPNMGQNTAMTNISNPNMAHQGNMGNYGNTMNRQNQGYQSNQGGNMGHNNMGHVGNNMGTSGGNMGGGNMAGGGGNMSGGGGNMAGGGGNMGQMGGNGNMSQSYSGDKRPVQYGNTDQNAKRFRDNSLNYSNSYKQ